MDASECKEQRNPQVKEGHDSRDACGNRHLEILLGLEVLELLLKHWVGQLGSNWVPPSHIKARTNFLANPIQ